jgi:hypothetical protein
VLWYDAVALSGEQYQALVPLTHVTVNGSINGSVSKVDAILGYTNKDTSPIECTFEFPLSDTAAVTSLTVTVGDKEIQAKI